MMMFRDYITMLHMMLSAPANVNTDDCLQQLKNRRYYYCLFSMATKIQAVSFQYFT
jgi:hypothetical protein